MRTAAEVIEAALTECAVFFDPELLATGAICRRINVRQHELFALAAEIDTDFFGECAVGDVVAGMVDFRELLRGELPGIPAAERITRVEVAAVAPGSRWPVSQPIHVVPSNDPEGHVPPRVTLRSGVFRQVDQDLDGIEKIEVIYSRRPAPIATEDDLVELDEPWAELLVWDVARFLAAKAPESAAAEIERAITYFSANETALLEKFGAHVRDFAATVDRFG